MYIYVLKMSEPSSYTKEKYFKIIRRIINN